MSERSDATSDVTDGDELTHTTETGDVQMVDVGEKPDTGRRAVARGEIHLTESTIDAVRRDDVAKGDVLATARVGAVQAVKHTWETIPMCHQIPITNVETEFDVADDRVSLEVAVETTGKTGCEMEALEGVTTGLNVVWDMVKAAEKEVVEDKPDSGVEASGYPGTSITDVEVVSKEKRSLE
jgi:cyclic pyranopterin phosphate synthase